MNSINSRKEKSLMLPKKPKMENLFLSPKPNITPKIASNVQNAGKSSVKAVNRLHITLDSTAKNLNSTKAKSKHK